MASTILTDGVTGGTNSHATSVYALNMNATDFIHAGVVGPITLNTGSGGTGSFCVNADASPDMGITLKAGQAYYSVTPSGQTAQKLRISMAADYTAYTIAANSSGSTKYDWIYLSSDATKANNPASDSSDVTSVYTSRSSSNTTDNGSPPTYGLLLAVVTVANGASSITNSNISDKRTVATFRSTPVASGVNSLDFGTSATGNSPTITAQGSDTNIGIALAGKGTGSIRLGSLVANAISTAANAGNAGGTWSYFNLGGWKVAYCIGTAATVNTNVSVIFTPPSSFFSNVLYVGPSVVTANNVVYIFGVSYSASSIAVQMQSTTSMSATPAVLVIGN